MQFYQSPTEAPAETDKRAGDKYGRLPNDVIARLPVEAVAVAALRVTDRTNWTTSQVRLSRLGVSRRQFQRVLRALQAADVIAREPGRSGGQFSHPRERLVVETPERGYLGVWRSDTEQLIQRHGLLIAGLVLVLRAAGRPLFLREVAGRLNGSPRTARALMAEAAMAGLVVERRLRNGNRNGGLQFVASGLASQFPASATVGSKTAPEVSGCNSEPAVSEPPVFGAAVCINSTLNYPCKENHPPHTGESADIADAPPDPLSDGGCDGQILEGEVQPPGGDAPTRDSAPPQTKAWTYITDVTLTLDGEFVAVARAVGWDNHRIAIEWAKFCSHHTAQRSRSRSWLDTWRVWVLRGVEYDERRSFGGAGYGRGRYTGGADFGTSGFTPKQPQPPREPTIFEKEEAEAIAARKAQVTAKRTAMAPDLAKWCGCSEDEILRALADDRLWQRYEDRAASRRAAAAAVEHKRADRVARAEQIATDAGASLADVVAAIDDDARFWEFERRAHRSRKRAEQAAAEAEELAQRAKLVAAEAEARAKLERIPAGYLTAFDTIEQMTGQQVRVDHLVQLWNAGDLLALNAYLRLAKQMAHMSPGSPHLPDRFELSAQSTVAGEA